MDGLALYLGEGYEFVLHSLEDLSHSVVKIINGHYSNRKPGAPITDFGLNLLRDLEQKQKPEPQVYFNYQNGTLLKSTTIPILGDNGRMIAMLCINFHTDIPMATFLSGFFPAGSPSPLPQRSETFSDNVDHFIHAALDQAKTEKQAQAQELQSKLEAGEDPAQLAQEYADQLTGDPSISQVMSGSSVASASYAQWAQDTARQKGDVTLSEYDAGPSSYYYYVVRFEGRARNDETTATVRHILVAADQDEGASEPTEDQYAAAKTKAEELLDQWKSGAATEESFAELAKANSADTGSAADGGLITDIYSGSGYVSTFTDWALDAARQPGDTGIVETSYGVHVMYFDGFGNSYRDTLVENALRTADYNAWHDGVVGDNTYTTVPFGMKFTTK